MWQDAPVSAVDPEALSGASVFAGLTPAQRARVLAAATVEEFPAGEALTEQGAYSHRFFLLLDGRASVERDGQGVASLGPGEFLGEVSLLGGGKATATVRCDEATRCVVLRREDFWRALEAEPAIALRILEIVCRRIAEEHGGGPRGNLGER